MADKKIKNQNPLLQPIPSFDDFTHNAILLSPAPVIAKSEVNVLTNFNTDVLTDDLDTFSEISLDTRPETVDPNISSKLPLYNPLDGLYSYTDPANEDIQSLSSGLTASFAQLPTVASTVFSTFSRVIKGESPASEQADQQVQLRAQESFDQTYQQPTTPDFHEHTPPAPTFFSPNDPSINTSIPTLSNQTSGNTFRLGGKKKKTYAHIPGLSTSATPPIPKFQNITQNVPEIAPDVLTNEHTEQVQSKGIPQATYIDSHQNQPELHISQPSTGKFSFSSLIPSATNLLQKVPRVKDFAQNIKEAVAPEPIPVSTDFESTSYYEISSQPTGNNEESHIPQQVQSIHYNFNVTPFSRTQQQDQEIVLNQTSTSPAEYLPTSTVPTIPKGTVEARSGGNPYSNRLIGKSAIYKNPALIPSTQAHKSDLLQREATGASNSLLTPTEYSDPSSYKILPETNLGSYHLNKSFENDLQRQALFKQDQPVQSLLQFPEEPTLLQPSYRISQNLSSLFSHAKPKDKIDSSSEASSKAFQKISPDEKQKVLLNTKTQDPANIVEEFQGICQPIQATNPVASINNIIEPSIVEFHTIDNLHKSEKGQKLKEASQITVEFGAINEASQNTTLLESQDTIHKYQRNFGEKSTDKIGTESFSDLPKSYPPPLETVNQQDIAAIENLTEKDLTAFAFQTHNSRDKLNNVLETTGLPRFTPVNFFIDSPHSLTPTIENSRTANTGKDFFNNNIQVSNQQISNFFDQPAEQSSNNFFRTSSETQDYVIRPEATHTIDSYSSFRSESISELNQDIDYDELPTEMSEEVDTASTSKLSTNEIKYRPVYYHWFYHTKTDSVGSPTIWKPFSMNDSMVLEEIFLQQSNVIVHTDGGRFDVNISERRRVPVYWKDEPSEVRRCSWFYKSLDSKFIPYEEAVADKLEEEFKNQTISGDWHKKIPLPNGETVVFHGPTVFVHFLQSQNPDSWGNPAHPTNRPRIVKRGFDEFSIEDGEPEQIDHLLFMVHGIGKACDLKFRSIEEAVDEYRSIAFQLVQSHYRTSCDLGAVGRVEVLPISWHAELHSEEIGIDEKIKLVTLESIPKLRTFANETLLDILFYSSPVYCQQIINFVGNSMNGLYSIFRQRNPNFCGQVSLGGHSLGSLILFDLLSHQQNRDLENYEHLEENANKTSLANLGQSHPTNYQMGVAGTGQPSITYPQLNFKPRKFFALGSPISMFVIVRGIHTLGVDFKLPTCEGFYNIFHPFDPVAYRCEPLINPELSQVKPVVISHHKGRKRMHLELKETMARVSADIKQKVVNTFKNTMQAMYPFKKKDDEQSIEHELNKALEDQHLKLDSCQDDTTVRKRTDSISTTGGSSDIDPSETDQCMGLLNNGRRIDYVLQEAPLEFFNEYLFALTSHVCYWESEDTILFMMKEIYSSMGIQTDSQIPQHTMTIERPSSSNITPTK